MARMNDLKDNKSKAKGKRELITDVLTQYKSTSNKRPKIESNNEQDAADALESLRSASFDDRSTGSKKSLSSKKTVSSAKETKKAPMSDNESQEPSRPEEFIDIEKAQYTFPERLMELLTNGTVSKAMWWLPGGEAFALVPNIFYDTVLSKHFQGTKFESFTRKLNRWGFKRLSGQGVPQGTIAYFHRLFKKNQPELMKKMRSGKSNQGPESQPGFQGVKTGPVDIADDVKHVDPAAALAAVQRAGLAGLAGLPLGAGGGLLPPSLLLDERLRQALTAQIPAALAMQQAMPQTVPQAMQQAMPQARQGMIPEQIRGVGLQGANLQNLIAQQNINSQVRRQVELLAAEELRAAQETAQLRAHLLAQNGLRQPPRPQAIPSAAAPSSLLAGQVLRQQPGVPPASMGGINRTTEEQLRMLLLRRQLERNGNAM